MDTKLKGDVAEQAAILEALRREWGVLKPVGDRLSYDLVFDVDGALVRIQVKSAWRDKTSQNYVVDTRRTKTNRRVMLREKYTTADFDFALLYLQELDIFYIIPAAVFVEYGSGIQLVEAERRQRKPNSAKFRNAWELILQWAARKETGARSPVKLGETLKVAIPSQARQRFAEQNIGGKV